MKLLICSLLFSLTVSAQTFGGAITDAPQHAFAFGMGVGPTSKDFSGFFGFGDKITGGTYSYSGATVIPNIITNANGSKSLSVTPIVHTGVKQILFQANRFTLAADGGVGVSMPTVKSSAFNFSALASVDFLWRLNSAQNKNAGGANNYLSISPQFTQLTGTNGGTVVSFGIGWVHGLNGQ